MVGHGAGRPRRRPAARRDHLDGLPRCRRREAGSRRPGARAGLRPAEAAHAASSSPAARPRSRARIRSPTSCGSGGRTPIVARATWKYLEPKDWLNLKLTGRCAATYDSIVLHWITDNRDLARIDYDPASDAAVRRRPRAVPGSRAGHVGARPVARRRSRASSACPPGIPVVGGTPDLQSAAIGSGAVRDFEGHLYVGTSSWLTCHVPFKKTDLFHGVASLPSPLPGQVLRGRRAGGRGREPQLAPRQRDLPGRRAAAVAGARRLLLAASTTSPRPRRRAATA